MALRTASCQIESRILNLVGYESLGNWIATDRKAYSSVSITDFGLRGQMSNGYLNFKENNCPPTISTSLV
jgi:hypothetical protein